MLEHKSLIDRTVINSIWQQTALNRTVLGRDDINVRSIIRISWKKPPSGYVKLNVDDIAFGNPGRAGFGGLVRTEDGKWIIGFSGFIGHTTNLHAELKGIQRGLQFLWEAGYRRVVCETDSMDAVHLIEGGNNIFHLYCCIIQDIKRITCLNWDVRICHTLREGNGCADIFAKMGARSDADFQEWRTPPASVRPMLTADATGVEFIRP